MVSYLSKCQKEELIGALKKYIQKMVRRYQAFSTVKVFVPLLNIIFSNNPSQYLQFVFPTTGFLI